MDYNMMQELMMGKKKGAMDDSELKAKMGVLQEIRNLAASHLGEDVKGLKKVTVAAPDKAGLETGLDKAKELMSGDSEDNSEDDAEDKADGGSDEDTEDQLGDMSPEEIDALIAALQAKKAKAC